MLVVTESLIGVGHLAAPWTIAHQAPLSLGVSQARILQWVAIPPPGDLPDPGIKQASPAWQADSYH